MNKNRQFLFTLGILLLLSLSSLPNVNSQEIAVNQFPLIEVEENATRFMLKVDNSMNRHFMYLYGTSDYTHRLPALREPAGDAFVASHVLRYGTLNISKISPTELDPTSTQISFENVTDQLVFPYYYNFQIDSIGRVHTTYISQNYTLFYAVRDTSGVWTHSNLTSPDEWFAMAPDIAINDNNDPLIVYAASYKENGGTYFGVPSSLSGFTALHYMTYNGTSWKLYDLSENNNDDPFGFGLNRPPTNFLVYNPSILFEDGQVFIAYSNVNGLALQTRIHYLTIPQFPNDIADDPEKSFKDITYKYARLSSFVAAIYTRPVMQRIGEGIFLAYGAWTTGGITVSYLADAFELPHPDRTFQEIQWESKELDAKFRNRQVESVSGVMDTDGAFHIAWSIYDLFDTAQVRYTYDVFEAEFKPQNGEIGEFNFTKITESDNTFNTYPNVNVNTDGELEYLYFNYVQNSAPTLTINFLKPELEVEKGGATGFLLAIVVVSSMVGLWYVVVQLIPAPEKKIEYLPHQVNLKDVITED